MSKEKKIDSSVPISERFVDVEKAIAGKSPRLSKLLPGFLIRYIKKLVHQEEINRIIYTNKEKQGLDFIHAGLEEMGIKTAVTGEENIPEDGGVFIVANHPLGALDGVALMRVVGKFRSDLRFFVNDLLMQVKNFAPFFVPVNKHGKNSKEYIQQFEEVYSSDKCLLIFPAGLVSRRDKRGSIEDLTWRKSVINKAVQYKKTILPIYIDAKNSKRFYNIAYWRKKLGIKANIEMLYLSDEMFKQKGETIKFKIGRPISWKVFSEDKTSEYWVDRLKRHVYAIHSGNEDEMLPIMNEESNVSK